MNYNQFFSRGARTVARDLLGRSLALISNEGFFGQITETGAYEGGNDTDSRKGMLYAPGTMFLMPFRGTEMFNIATGARNDPSCVEIRRIETADGVISGPGAITNYFGIQGEDGTRFMDLFSLIGEPVGAGKIAKVESGSENCLGRYSIRR